MKARKKYGKKQSVVGGEHIQTILFIVFLALGSIVGILSTKVSIRAAFLSGVLILYLSYQAVKTFKLLDEDELKSNTILPYLTAWYAAWVFFYNYFRI